MVKFFNKSIFGKVLLEIEKVVKNFSIFDKFFPKLVYYCVPLRHTLVKPYKYIEREFYQRKTDKQKYDLKTRIWISIFILND